MKIENALTFPFKDKNWLAKLGIFALFLLLVVTSPAATGYSLEITRRVMKGETKGLPEWNKWGKKFLDGLVLALAFFVYSLPVWLLAILPAALVAVPALLSGNRDFQAISDLVRGAGSVLYLGLGCLSILYSLGLSMFLPAVVIRYAQEGKFGACFRLREVFAVMRRSGYFTAWIVTLGISAVAGTAGGVIGLIPVLGWVVAIAAVAFCLIVSAHLFGQVGAGSPVRGSVRAAAAHRRPTKSASSTKGKRTSRTLTASKRKPASTRAPRKTASSTASRRKPAASGKSKRKK